MEKEFTAQSVVGRATAPLSGANGKPPAGQRDASMNVLS
jgi:hypothetical protein